MNGRVAISGDRISGLRTLRLMVAGAIFVAGVPILMAQAPAGAPGAGLRQAPPPPPPPTAGAHLEIMDGSSASYRVTEQFVGISFPNDAIGTTPTVAGVLTIAADGSIAPGSKLTIDLRNLKSDQDQRDGYVKNRLLETDKFPMAEFVPTKLQGLPALIPTAGQAGIQLTGNLTIHGVTKEVTSSGITTFNPRESTAAGRARTTFAFGTFGLTKPSIARLMSVEDKIELEIVFRLKRS